MQIGLVGYLEHIVAPTFQLIVEKMPSMAYIEENMKQYRKVLLTTRPGAIIDDIIDDTIPAMQIMATSNIIDDTIPAIPIMTTSTSLDVELCTPDVW